MSPSPEEILKEAKKAPTRTDLGEHLETIRTLRQKDWPWRDVAAFLQERGIDVDHTRLIRFMQRHEEPWKVPPAATYCEALKKIEAAGKLRRHWWAMLLYHFRAHNRVVTYTQLAAAAASSGAKVSINRPHTFANLEYGTLGKVLGEAAGMRFLPSSRPNKPFYSSAIGIGSSATPEGAEFELVMHHELAKALETLLLEFESSRHEVAHV